jgi:hypothetical protein
MICPRDDAVVRGTDAGATTDVRSRFRQESYVRYFDLKKSAVLDRVWVGAWGQRGLEPRWRSGDPLCGKGADLD